MRSFASRLWVSVVVAAVANFAFAAPARKAPPPPALELRPIGGLIERDGKTWQPVEIFRRDPAKAAEAELSVEGTVAERKHLDGGAATTQILLPAVAAPQKAEVVVTTDGQKLTAACTLRPVRKLTIYVTPFPHMDLGYTASQPEVEKQQIEFIKQAIELCRKTADYPEGARFVWNVESLWGIDQYFRQQNDADKALLIDAIKKGWIVPSALYGNTLIGLCRPEEMLQLFADAYPLAELTGVKIDSIMHTDVPGVPWGFVTALSQAGIRYFSLAPNFRSRVGTFLPNWHDKPFWWVAPSGQEKVLVWLPARGYSVPTVMPSIDNYWAGEYMAELDACNYPYDLSYIRYGSDNLAPEPKLPEFVKDWNATYAWPKFKLAATSTVFAEMEKRYGDKLPEFKGDLTPYWEDGAGSSARETALNRNAAERIIQAQTLFAMFNPQALPGQAMHEAWRNVLLYSEHTWGDNDSVNDAEGKETREQWAIKQAFALDADKQSQTLFEQAIKTRTGDAVASAVDVINTTSWPRTELVVVSKELSTAGDRVTDLAGHAIPSQRLSTGELALLAVGVPPFGVQRFNITAGAPAAPPEPVHVDAASIANGGLSARVDPNTGGIVEFKYRGMEGNYAVANGQPLNDYVYMIGDKPEEAQGSAKPTITIVEKGPLVAVLRIASPAPGCNQLTRDLRIVAGSDHLDLLNTLDKQRVAHDKRPRRPGAVSYQNPTSKESVNFAFPFNVIDGQIRLNMPFAVIRPEADQLPGSCKDWMEVGRWADVSNERHGVTLAVLDAPLVEIGQLSTLLGGAMEPEPWRKKIEPTQKLYSWVMNNHWYTNYCAYQEGIVTFRYALRPHRQYEPAEAERFATGLTQPLIVDAARGPAPQGISLLRVEPADVLVSALKPSADGKALIVRLFGASGQERQVKLTWSSPRTTWLSDLGEKPLRKAGETLTLPGWGVMTLRVENAAAAK